MSKKSDPFWNKKFPAPHRCPYCGKIWKRSKVRRWDASRQEWRETGEYMPRSHGHSRRVKHIRQCGTDFGTSQSSLLDWSSGSEKL